MRKSDFISLYRQLAAAMLENIGELEQLRQEWDSLDYTNSMVQGDFIGENANITKQELSDAVATLGAISTLLAAGHRTNLYKII